MTGEALEVARRLAAELRAVEPSAALEALLLVVESDDRLARAAESSGGPWRELSRWWQPRVPKDCAP